MLANRILLADLAAEPEKPTSARYSTSFSCSKLNDLLQARNLPETESAQSTIYTLEPQQVLAWPPAPVLRRTPQPLAPQQWEVWPRGQWEVGAAAVARLALEDSGEAAAPPTLLLLGAARNLASWGVKDGRRESSALCGPVQDFAGFAHSMFDWP